ncbi:hypothetical protein Bca4012_067723 [Brassica carinata]
MCTIKIMQRRMYEAQFSVKKIMMKSINHHLSYHIASRVQSANLEERIRFKMCKEV